MNPIAWKTFEVQNRDMAVVGLQEKGYSSLLSTLLVNRGQTDPQQVNAYLSGTLKDLPDPLLMMDMSAAAERLSEAVTGREKIEIHGDFDVDGMTATALMVEFLSSVGGNVSYHIPLRLVDGYGLSAEAIGNAAKVGVNLIVSVDCGISAHGEAHVAGDLGIDLIITDHHQAGDTLPAAIAVLNPHRNDCLFPYTELSGVGVAFFLCMAVRARLRQLDWFSADGPEPDLRSLFDLVALGTIADQVPLTGVNRLLVRYGLKLIQQGRRAGIQELLRLAGVDTANSTALSFQVIPRMNAAGRLKAADPVIKLLLTSDSGVAQQLASHLNSCNHQRKKIENEIYSQAKEMAETCPEDEPLVLSSSTWHAGVIGIVAGRMARERKRTVVLISFADGVGKGSSRTGENLNLHQALSGCKEFLKGYGGHRQAAGLSLDREQFESFRAAFIRTAQKERSRSADPAVYYDLEIIPEKVTEELVEKLALLEPFGQRNPEPIFYLKAVTAKNSRVFGAHLRFQIVRYEKSDLSCILFNGAWAEEFLDEPIDLLAVPTINRFRGSSELQLRVLYIRPVAV